MRAAAVDAKALRRIAALLALLLWCGWLWATLHPGAPSMAMPDASGLRFPCLSYAPFRERGTAPTSKGLIIPAQAIERDLQQIAQVSRCVRVYGTANGLDAVPAVARRLGLRVWLGAWLGSDATLNRRELESALQLAADNADIVDRLVVGSEVLLRRELPVASLTSLLDEARRRAAVPVAYADVWEFWLQHANDLRAHVDEAVIHILPYWENEPVAAENGVTHVLNVHAAVRAQLAPLPVAIGETGWPSAGRMRAAARPGSDEQTRFLRELQSRASDLHRELPSSSLNVIEAFDQPWKVTLEGLAGASWGLFTADGVQRYQPEGVPAPRSPEALADAAMAGGAVVLLLLMLRALLSGADGSAGWRSAVALTGGAALGALCLLQARDLALLAIDGAPAYWRLTVLLGSALWGTMEMHALAGLCAQSGAQARAQAAHATPLPALRLAGVLATIAYALWLLLDGRYLDLAWPALGAPVLPLALQRLLGARDVVSWPAALLPTSLPTSPLKLVVSLLPSLLLALLAGGIIRLEGHDNPAALAVALWMLLLALCLLPSRLPLLGSRWRQPRS